MLRTLARLSFVVAALVGAGVAQDDVPDDVGTVYAATPPLERSYVGPSVAPFEHQNQHYNLFLPPTPPPPGGYPVLLHTELGSFVNSSLKTQLYAGVGLPFMALENGWAVVWGGVTVSRGAGTPNKVDEEPGVGYGPRYKGNGVFVPPTVAMPPDFKGDIHPYFDPERPMPEKDIIMLVQHIKEHAGSKELPLDPDAIVLHGRSGAGVMSWWLAAGPDRSDVWTSPQGQEVHDTRVRGAILRSAITWWDTLDKQISGVHFPRDELRAGGKGLYDRPAAKLGGAPQSWLEPSSALHYAFDEANHPGITRDVHNRAIHLSHGDVAVQSDVTPPYPSGVETDPHTAWAGAAFKTRFCNTLLSGYNDGATGIEDIVDSAPETFHEVELFLVDWLDQLLENEPPLWVDVGSGHAGTRGEPWLRACGTLEVDTPFSLEIGNALPGTTGSLVCGLSEIGARFKGGTLVPAPNLVVPLPEFSKTGGWSLAVTWPGAAPGLTIALQAWLVDAGATRGLSATNAIRAVTP